MDWADSRKLRVWDWRVNSSYHPRWDFTSMEIRIDQLRSNNFVIFKDFKIGAHMHWQQSDYKSCFNQLIL